MAFPLYQNYQNQRILAIFYTPSCEISLQTVVAKLILYSKSLICLATMIYLEAKYAGAQDNKSSYNEEDHNELLYCLVGVYGMVKRLKVLMDIATLYLFGCDMVLDWVEQEAHVAGCRSTSEAERYQGRKRKQENKGKWSIDLLSKQFQARSKMRDKLEDKFLREKRHRSEFLCQRRRQLDSISLYCDMMQQDGDLLSRKLSSQGDQEAALNDSAKGFLREFKLLIKVIKEGHVKMSIEESKLQTLRSQLDLFDKAWCTFLNSFVLWKVKDARLLGEDKVRAACQLEIYMIQKCKITPERDDTVLTHDKKAIQTRNTKGILSFLEG
ncbi:LOW QUALITY PROTEIN: hypothetical protein HID58_011200 [Brassica napus]|uniref:Uncharacterized protein n=1 Tax=Brassica napus TaxID=3708 RepID=A0ABQ7ZQ52_BRANA|nr:LOW QUALITY PROTEIN: hypothetical protein HID58_058429 [Brassica napus]KAH0934083.1 LOW QUALITY PROTEIN: hypothetical protein HID58_011200 [Brassica napus]